ncbi:radical SAM protein [Bacteroidota bacterium]
MSIINKYSLVSFRRVSIVLFFFSFIFTAVGVSRVFEIEAILLLMPKESINVLRDSPKWVYFVYFFAVISNFITIILMFKRNILIVRFTKISAAIMLIVISYHFFTTDNIPLIVAIEMFGTLVYWLVFAYFLNDARKKGVLQKSIIRTSVYLKIQSGCNYTCAHCNIPKLHGASRSDTLKHVVRYANEIAENGAKSIVILGDNVADYGTGEYGDLNHEHSFLDLVKALDKVGGIDRFRFQHIFTPMLSEKTLIFFRDSIRFSPHFNFRMLSGSDTVLEKMDSPFTRNSYKEVFENIKKLMPDAFLSVEIIVGFPGETEELFLETVNFLSDLDISYIDAIPYKDKIGTRAYKIKTGKISRAVRTKRKKILVELSKEKLRTFYEENLNKSRNVLFEKEKINGFVYGYTDNHIRVKTKWNPELCNTVHKVLLRELGDDMTMLIDFGHHKNNRSKRRMI